MKYEILGKVVDLELNKFYDAKKEVKLEPKVVEVLACFIRNKKKLISKEFLIDEVWKDQIVTDHSLKRVISKIRDLFNDDPKEPKVIETITNKGYIFIAELREYQAAKKRGFNKKRGIPILVILSFFYLLFINQKAHVPTFEEKQISSLKGIELDPAYYNDSILFISYIPETFTFHLNVKNKFNTNRLISENHILSSPVYDKSRNRIYFAKILPANSGIYSFERKTKTQKKIIPTAAHKLFSLHLNSDNSVLLFTDLNTQNKIVLNKYSFYDKKISQISFPDSSTIGDTSPNYINENLILFKRIYRNTKKKIISLDLNEKKESIIYENPNLIDFAYYDDKYILILEQENQKKALFLYDINRLKKMRILVNVDQIQNLKSHAFKKELLAEKWIFLYQMDLQIEGENRRLLETTKSNSHAVYHQNGIAFLSNRSGSYHVFQNENNTIEQISNQSFNSRSKLYSISDRLFIKEQSDLYQIDNLKSIAIDSTVDLFIEGESINQSYYIKENALYDLNSKKVKSFSKKIYNAFVNAKGELFVKYEKNSDFFYQSESNQKLQIPNFTSNDIRRFYKHKKGLYYFTLYKDEALIYFYNFVSEKTAIAYKLPVEAVQINGFSINKGQSEIIYSYLAEQESDIVLLTEIKSN